MQPAAYQALESPDKGALSEAVAVSVIVVLALMKILWASSVAHTIGAQAQKTDNLVDVHRTQLLPKQPDKKWTKSVLWQGILGIVVMIIIIYLFRLQPAYNALVQLIATLGGFSVVLKLVYEFYKKYGQRK